MNKKEIDKSAAGKLYSDALVWDNNLSWQVEGHGDADRILWFKKEGVKG